MLGPWPRVTEAAWGATAEQGHGERAPIPEDRPMHPNTNKSSEEQMEGPI